MQNNLGDKLSTLDTNQTPQCVTIQSFADLAGTTLASVTGQVGADEITFITSDGRTFRLRHDQDCCESVTIEDICGDLSDLIGTPILSADESTSTDNPEGITPPDYQDSFTWTFYRISTIKGSVVIRWYGESNGYYSESVEFAEVAQ